MPKEGKSVMKCIPGSSAAKLDIPWVLETVDPCHLGGAAVAL
jgi:hypothetical protein